MPTNEMNFNSPEGYQAMSEWYTSMLGRLQVPYESITVPTRYGDTHMLAAGPEAAPPVILLHGMEGTALSWRHQLNELAKDYRLYALDIIGSAGKSAPVRLPYTGTEYAEWLVDVLAGLGLHQASFIGMSNGGWLIFKLASQAPDAIAQAVLMSANGLVPVRFPYTLARMLDVPSIQAVKSFISKGVIHRDIVRTAVTLTTPTGMPIDPDEIEWFYLLARYYQYRFPPPPLADEHLRALKAPTLLLMGTKEQFFKPHIAIARARLHLPDLRHAEVVPGVGHNMVTDDPAAINARIRGFLARLSKSSSESRYALPETSPGPASAVPDVPPRGS